jgi:hypothetical protein
MSIGKLFTRSRSTSPSRRSSVEQEDILEATTSHVPDPIFKVAAVNKQEESEFRSLPTAEPFYTAAESNTMAPRGYKPSKINTQPQYHYNDSPSEIFNRQDHHFIDCFNEPCKPSEDILYSGTNLYQDNSYSRPDPYVRHSPTHSPDLFPRPSSGGSNNSSSASSESTPIDPTIFFSRPAVLNDHLQFNSLSSNSLRSYFDDNKDFFPSPRYGSVRSNASYEESLMNTIDGSRRSLMMTSSSNTGRRGPLHPNLYKNPHPHRSTHPTDRIALFKNDVTVMIDHLIKSQPPLRSQQEMDRYLYNGVRDLKAVSTQLIAL